MQVFPSSLQCIAERSMQPKVLMLDRHDRTFHTCSLQNVLILFYGVPKLVEENSTMLMRIIVKSSHALILKRSDS